MKIDQETNLILQTLDKSFHYPRKDNKRIDWKRILIKSSFNRVLYIFSQSLLEQKLIDNISPIKKSIEEIRAAGEYQIKKLSKTVKYITFSLQRADVPFLIAKTFKLRPFVTQDVDLLVKAEDLSQVLRAFEDDGLKIKAFRPKNQWDALGKGLLRIDIHTNFNWQGSCFLDNAILWSNSGYAEFEGKNYPIPNLEVEASTIMLNILYESRYISLLDFLYFRDIASKVNWNMIHEQSLKFGWSSAFGIFAQIYNGLIDILYPSNDEYKIIELSTNKKIGLHARISMPYVFSWSKGISIFAERIYKRRYFPVYDFAYFIFAKARFHLTNQRRVPMYHHWFPFDSL